MIKEMFKIEKHYMLPKFQLKERKEKKKKQQTKPPMITKANLVTYNLQEHFVEISQTTVFSGYFY